MMTLGKINCSSSVSRCKGQRWGENRNRVLDSERGHRSLPGYSEKTMKSGGLYHRRSLCHMHLGHSVIRHWVKVGDA